MGLDQYLELRRYVSKFDYSQFDRQNDEWPPPTSSLYDSLSNFAPAEFDKYSDFGGIQVSYPVGYWRKANAIHGWFVDNVQNGNDNCGSYYVSREQLTELRDLCKSALKQPAMAGDILPPTQGFFFGTYEIDEWYMKDMEYTIEMIDHIFSLIPEDGWDWSFYYSSSW